MANGRSIWPWLYADARPSLILETMRNFVVSMEYVVSFFLFDPQIQVFRKIFRKRACRVS